VTLKCRLEAADVRQRLQGPVLALVLEMAEVWFKNVPHIVFHDPLAAALVFRPELCQTERGAVRVDEASARTDFTPGEGRDQVAVDVDADAFFQEFFSVFDA
jgi:purine nucleosidase